MPMNQTHAGTADLGRDIEELQRPGLNGLCLAAMVVSWVWIATAGTRIRYDVGSEVASLGPAIWLVCACALSMLLRGAPLRLRIWVFLGGLIGCFVLGYQAQQAAWWFYAHCLSVSLAGVLAGTREAFTCALLSTLSAGLLLRGRYQDAAALQIVPAIGLMWAMAATSWLSARNLHTALTWAMNSQEQAWRTTREVQRRRGELRRAVESLELANGLLQRTTRELESARQAAEEASRAKARFVANVSHELRTPLNIIVGFAEMLCTLPETYGDLAWPQTARQDLLAIWRNAEHLLGMMDDVLDLAQIEVARLPVIPEPTDLGQMVPDAVELCSTVIKNAGLELRLTLPDSLPVIDVDRARIRQVILNLVNNAVRFTQQGFIEVGAEAGADEVTIFVRDTGHGIPADKLETIFGEFEQADMSLRRPHRGAGLGLAICRHFVQLHGGRIWAESQVGQGSTFYFVLPIKPSTQHVPALHRHRPLAQPESAPRSIVVLCSRARVSRFLQRRIEGLELQTAKTVAEAARLVDDLHPAAALVVADGTELTSARNQARALLEEIAPFDLPTIVCTLPTEGLASEVLGVGGFLIKPVSHGDVIDAIRRHSEHPRRLLVADDDRDMLRLLVRILAHEWETCEILTATSGREALGLAKQRPEVVLLDLSMPGVTGMDVIQQLRADPETSSIPIIVITARSIAEDVAALRKGEVSILKASSLSAGELARLSLAIAGCLAPQYTARSRGRARQDSFGAARA